MNYDKLQFNILTAFPQYILWSLMIVYIFGKPYRSVAVKFHLRFAISVFLRAVETIRRPLHRERKAI